MVRRLARILAMLLVAFAAVTAGPVVVLRYADPPTSAFMLRDRFADRRGEQRSAILHRWVDWARISPELRLAVVAAEDQKFPFHAGFDVAAIRAALADHLAGDGRPGRLRGASTISQQVAKNLFLWPGRSWLRKGLEAHFTLLIEILWPKRRILEIYLNVAQFGDNVYGVEAAATTFFGKSALTLDRAEAALMAAVLPNPVRLRVSAPSRHVRQRQRWIARQMGQLGGESYLRGLD